LPGSGGANGIGSSANKLIIIIANPDKIRTSYVPTEEDLRILHQEIDPGGMVLGK